MNGSAWRVGARWLALVAIGVQAMAAPGLVTRALASELAASDMMPVCASDGHGGGTTPAPDRPMTHHADSCCLVAHQQHVAPAVLPDRAVLALPSAETYRPLALRSSGGARAPPYLRPPARAPPTLS